MEFSEVSKLRTVPGVSGGEIEGDDNSLSGENSNGKCDCISENSSAATLSKVSQIFVRTGQSTCGVDGRGDDGCCFSIARRDTWV